MTRAELDAALIRAHETGDRAGLIGLYMEAAEGGPPGQAAFFLTQAYIFALEIGDPRAPRLRALLVALGAERQGKLGDL